MKGAKEVATYFAANLCQVRGEAGLSQEEVGRLASLHRTEVGLLERGARVPRIDTVIKLAAALGVSPDRLLAGIGWRPAQIGEATPGEFEHHPKSDSRPQDQQPAEEAEQRANQKGVPRSPTEL